MDYISLFSGLGGLDLGLARAGLTCIHHVELDGWCRSVLARHWPSVPQHDDVRTFRPPRAELVVGGPPCQPFSRMGAQLGEQDERFLWPEFFRVLVESGAQWAIVENVRTLLTQQKGDVFRRILQDIRGLGLDASWTVRGAASFNLAHLRERLFLVAHPSGVGMEGLWEEGNEVARGLDATALPNGPSHRIRGVEPDLVRALHESPRGVVRARRVLARQAIRGLGNCVVPPAGEWLGRLILRAAQELERTTNGEKQYPQGPAAPDAGAAG